MRAEVANKPLKFISAARNVASTGLAKFRRLAGRSDGDLQTLKNAEELNEVLLLTSECLGSVLRYRLRRFVDFPETSRISPLFSNLVSVRKAQVFEII